MPTEEFINAAAQALDQVKSGATDLDRAYMDQIHFQVSDSPTNADYQSTGAAQDTLLLAKYTWEPIPQITIYETSVETMAPGMGGLNQALKDVIWHEVYQHHFGMDHTKETIAAGMTPALWMSPYTSDPQCVSCQGECGLHASAGMYLPAGYEDQALGYGAYPKNVTGNVGYPESGYEAEWFPYAAEWYPMAAGYTIDQLMTAYGANPIHPYISPYYTPENYPVQPTPFLDYNPLSFNEAASLQ